MSLPMSFPALRRVLPAVSAAALVLTVAWAAPGAQADTAPVPPETVSTVSADVLPTVQVNGVVWAQLVVGTKVYATGSFTQARPAGAAPGTSQTARKNILAYDLTTGKLITGFNASLNAQGLALAASSDGKKIYVGGDFTNVNGTAKGRIVALDPNTGAIVPGFKATVNNRVRAIAVSDPNVYAGGSFSTANGIARTRLAGFRAVDGAVTTWNPGANDAVYALVAPKGKDKVVAAGRFTQLGHAAAYGMGAVHWTSGASKPWPANTVVKNAGADAAIYSLTTNGTTVFGTGYTYLVAGTDQKSGNFEGTFAADATTGALNWVTGCRGDTYSSAVAGGILYYVGHNHDCSSIGGNPQYDPYQFQRANASTTGRGPNNAVNLSGNFKGRPAPQLLHWLPTLTAGEFTGQGQAAWSVTGNNNWVVLAGEFTKINGTAQQGLARFQIKNLAPNKQGPQGYAELKPTLAAAGAGAVKVTWKAEWDRDNRRLTYEVLRGTTVVNTRTADSNWWTRPAQTFTDTGVPAGTQSYRVRATDPLGNTNTSEATTITVP